MKTSRRLLGVALAFVAAALAAAPAAQATMFDRIRLDAVPYEFEDVRCGIEVQVEGPPAGSSTCAPARATRPRRSSSTM